MDVKMGEGLVCPAETIHQNHYKDTSTIQGIHKFHGKSYTHIIKNNKTTQGINPP